MPKVPKKVTGPEPSALLWPIFRVPAKTLVPPLKVLFPEISQVAEGNPGPFSDVAFAP